MGNKKSPKLTTIKDITPKDNRLMEIKIKLYYWVIVQLIMNYTFIVLWDTTDFGVEGEGDSRASVSLRLHSN